MGVLKNLAVSTFALVGTIIGPIYRQTEAAQER